MLTTIPFAGFYQSYHDAELDDTLNHMFSDRDTGCEVNEELRNRAFSACRWGLVHVTYALNYANALAEEFKINMAFESLKSPREYNFTTDTIYCTINEAEVRRLRAETDEKIFRELARQRFTSRSGFISFYSPDVDDWGDVDEWDHNQVGTLIEAHVQMMHSDDWCQMAESDLMETHRCNGRLDEWISNATPNIERLLKIHDYLEDRKGRSHE